MIRTITGHEIEVRESVEEIVTRMEEINRLDPRPETVLALKLNDRRGAVLVNLRSIETVTR